MPHIFPRKAYKAGEAADPVALNKDIQSIVEKAAAGLGEQDLASAVLTAANIGANAYVQAYETKQGVTLGLTAAGTGYAKQNPANAATVLYSAEWQVITDITSAAELAKTLTTGEDKLWILAQTQMAGWLGTLGDALAALSHSDDPYRVQVALRVDEGVVEDTITGTRLFPDYPPRQLYTGAQATSTSNDFDFRHVLWQKNGVGLPNHLQPCRVSKVVPVSEGSHTVSVVVRRLPKENFDLDNDGDGSCMQVFNRRLFILQLKGSSKSTASSPTLTTPAFNEDGQVLSAASLLTDRLNVIRDGLNDVPEAAIQRGALMAPHLPSCVKYVDCEVLAPSGTVVIPAPSTYNGYGTATGWQVVTDGAGTSLMVDNGGAGFTLTGNAGVIVVLANVQVVRLNVAANRTDYIAGVFIIGYKDNINVWNYVAETEAVITPRNESDPIGADGSTRLAGITAGQDKCDEDVPLLWVVDTAVLLAANANASLIKEIKVFQATYDMTRAALSVNMETQRGSLTAAYLLGVTLG